MKNIFIFAVLISSCLCQGTWNYISGTMNQAGSYGTKGVTSSSNTPGARRGAASITDSQGNLYIFGGSGYDANSLNGLLTDLWKYDGRNWTWLAGSTLSSLYGSYGTQGTPSSFNYPGSREGSGIWVDSSNQVWIFGGTGYPKFGVAIFLNDLWRFDGTNWAWMQGNVSSTFGKYGTKGVASALNNPGGRLSPLCWTDSQNNFWMYGGEGNGVSTTGFLSDVWKFDGSNWTWIAGPNSTDPTPRYGTPGIGSALNVPPGRRNAVHWLDSQGNLYMFGGLGAAGNVFNDLWRFDGQVWTWVAGPSTTNGYGAYGSQGVGSPANYPGSRYGSVSWVDSFSQFWLFGGYGYFTAGSNSYMNDLWKFDGTKWTWVTGSNFDESGYGVGSLSSASSPGSRYGSVGYIDYANRLWLFGGFGSGFNGSGSFNEVWRLNTIPFTTGALTSASLTTSFMTTSPAPATTGQPIVTTGDMTTGVAPVDSPSLDIDFRIVTYGLAAGAGFILCVCCITTLTLCSRLKKKEKEATSIELTRNIFKPTGTEDI